MDIKNFKTFLDRENVRERISVYAHIFNEQMQEFAKKEMAEHSIDYQTAVNRFFIFKLAEEAYHRHIEAVASDYYTHGN